MNSERKTGLPFAAARLLGVPVIYTEDWHDEPIGKAVVAAEHADALAAQVADEERWMREMLADFRIPYDDHKVGRRIALAQWMAERMTPNDSSSATARL